MAYHGTLEQRNSDQDPSKRDIPSFIEPRPPLISNPFMRPRPEKGTKLLELFEDDSEMEEPELVKVYLRLKPCNVPSNLYDVRSNKYLITSVDTATAGHGRRTQHNVSKMYTFSHIFGPDSSQKEIFENVVKGNLKKLPEGHNFTLLTYGASGSGKTYTLMGTVSSPGLVPRSLEYIFKIVEAAQTPLYKPADGGTEKLGYTDQEYELKYVKNLRQVSAPLREKYRRMSVQLYNDFATSTLDLSNRIKYYVWVSFVEIYNEAVYDLLDPSVKRSTSKLRIREDTNGYVYVKGVTHAFVRNGQEAYDVLVAGKHNLQVAATGVHAQSSRSHCIFTITMLTETETSLRTSYVRLCDLAGCERARRTRNTGARMAESRAINSSLHVLERCLHTLRRNQRLRPDHALIPYRESKLTRLLGAGLSGVRGEAVSMVVTLNPAAEFVHETRHVLQLAAIARDIQVNSTIEPELTFESSTQNTTVESSFELTRLRSDNERLHYELIQAQSHISALSSEIEEKQRSVGNTMRELVEEAKDMTEQYYKDQIRAMEDRHRSDIEDLVEEYECKLRDTKTSLQNKISQLQILLEEKLTAERLARVRAEEEIQHLRVCIDERDEKGSNENISAKRDDIVCLTDSEHESDVDSDDPCNESLEPTFKKEDINRSRLLRQSLPSNSSDSTNNYDDSENDDIDDNVTEKSADTVKDEDTSEEDAGNSIQKIESTFNMINYIDDINKSSSELVNANKLKSSTRETYCVKDIEAHNSSKHADNTNNSSYKLSGTHLRGTYCFRESDEISSKNDNPEDGEIEFKKPIIRNFKIENKETKTEMLSKTLINKIEKVAKMTPGRDSSLSQFEQLEIAAKACNRPSKRDTDVFRNIKILQGKRNYFDDNNDSKDVSDVNSGAKPLKNTSDISTSKPLTRNDNFNDLEDIKTLKENRNYLDNIDINVENETKKVTEFTNVIHLKSDDVISQSVVKDDISNDYVFTTMKPLSENITKKFEIPSINNIKISTKKHVSVDLFEEFDSPLKNVEKVDNKENILKSIEKLKLNTKDDLQVLDTDDKIKLDCPSTVNKPLQHQVPVASSDDETNPYSKINNCNQNDSIEEFDNIYKDVTPRVTEFELLVSQEIDNFNDTKNDKAKEHKQDIIMKEEQKKDQNEIKTKTEELTVPAVRYNLRHKTLSYSETKDNDKQKTDTQKVLLTSHSKCESELKTKRNLQLRKVKNVENEELDKLKDIKNLQQEFSDVTLDVPAPKKDIKDIPSPERTNGEENLPPSSVRSCPSKSITRSRRKLFTPLVEPLEESLSQTGDSNECIYIPRPSYHRRRARRKL